MANTALQEAKELQVGDKAPDFTLPTDGNDSFSLSSYKGKKVALYFYPKDDTPGCTQESKEFRDAIEAFEAANTVILGLSKDDVVSHDKFKEKYCLPFALASDVKGDVINAYGVWKQKSMFGKKYMGIERSTFLINEEGKIQKIWRKVSVDGHVAEVLEATKA